MSRIKPEAHETCQRRGRMGGLIECQWKVK